MPMLLPELASRSASRDGTVGDVDGGLGDAVHVDELRLLVAVAVEPRAQALEFERLAAEDDVAQREVGRRLAAGRPG